MFLDYLALVLLMVSLTLVFYTFIYIHDLPHKIAKEREHPHEEAIHVACWLSLFTLHAMWPLVFTWAVMHKKPSHVPSPAIPQPGHNGDLAHRIAALEERLGKIEATPK
jgi:Na+/H+ antiporter NhaD/arsenite permease-like protein